MTQFRLTAIYVALSVLLIGFAGTEPWAQNLFVIAIGLLAAFNLHRESGEELQSIALLVSVIPLLGLFQLGYLGTEYRFATLNASELWMAYAAFAWLCCRTAAAEFSRHKQRALIYVLGTCTCLFGLLHFWTCGGRLLWTGSNEFGATFAPFINRDHFGVFCELILPFALYQVASGQTAGVHWLAATILAAGIVASASRMAFLVMMLEIATFLVVYRRNVRTSLAVAALAIGGLAAITGGPAPLIRKLRDGSDISARTQMTQAAWNMGLERPFTGHGLGTFEVVYPRFATFDSGSRVDHAHNDFLEWFAEGGITLPVCMLVFGFVVGRNSLQAPWTIGVLAVLMHSIVDFPWRIPAIVAFSLAIAATAYPLPSSASSKTRVKKSLEVGEQPI